MNRACNSCGATIATGKYCARCAPAERRRKHGAADQRLRALVLERDGQRCHYCGGHATRADHKVPISKGGSSTLDNLVAACDSCNRQKADLMPAQFARRRPYALGDGR